MSVLSPFVTEGYWLSVADGDARAMALFKRHYSYYEYKDGRPRRLFVGPGEKMVLLTYLCDALFIWRKFRSMDNQDGVNCSVFRNESDVLSSTLILDAMDVAWRHKGWEGERLYTYVKASAIKSVNLGYCFKQAGWTTCGITKVNKLTILEVRQ